MGLYDIFDNLSGFVIVSHIDNREIVYCNNAARQLFGNNSAGKPWEDFLKHDSLSRKHFRQSLKDESSVFDELINNKWYRISSTPGVLAEDKALRIFIGLEITDLKTGDGCGHTAGSRDSLTGAAVRQAGFDYLKFYLQEARSSGAIFTVCYIDLNDLKYINDNFGHSEGDEYLKAVASSIMTSIRSTDIFSRVGGDEFLLIFPNCCYEIAEKIMDIVSNKLQFISETKPVHYTIAYGIMEVNTETTLDMQYILDAVDSKMYYMKREYKLCRGPLPQAPKGAEL